LSHRRIPRRTEASDTMPETPKPKPEPCRSALTYTLPDAARISGLSQATLRRHAKAGRLRLLRLGGRTLLCGDSLRRALGIAA
jgi:hypothetical protein